MYFVKRDQLNGAKVEFFGLGFTSNRLGALRAGNYLDPLHFPNK